MLNKNKKKTILYIPAIYRCDKGLWPPTTPSCLYYRWQRKLWDLFVKKDRFDFIWKAGPRTSNLVDPIKELRASNIRYSTKKLSRELKHADIVLVDIASTPMYEAIIAGKTLIYMYYRDVPDKIRKDVLDVVFKENFS